VFDNQQDLFREFDGAASREAYAECLRHYWEHAERVFSSSDGTMLKIAMLHVFLGRNKDDLGFFGRHASWVNPPRSLLDAAERALDQWDSLPHARYDPELEPCVPSNSEWERHKNQLRQILSLLKRKAS
jgi:hypothetical protein